MSNIIVTPDIVRRVDSNLRYIYTDAWVRRAQGQWWRRVAKTRTSSTKTEIIQWLLDTAKIRPMGDQGGSLTFEDLTEIAHIIENEKFGVGLNLSADEISDALGGTAATGSAIDRAARWAKHVGGAGAYWPQGQMAYLLKNGKVLPCYDGLPYFHGAHWVNPYLQAGTTFANLLLGYSFSPTNLARVTAYVRGIRAPDGIPRHLIPRIVLAGVDLQYGVTQALTADVYTDPRNSMEGAAATNVIKTSYGYQEPVIAPELDEPGVWYLGCELLEDDELGGLIYQEREPYSLTSYAPMTDVDLARMDSYEWQQKGRNAAAYGHPFLLFRIEPTGGPSPVLPPL